MSWKLLSASRFVRRMALVFPILVTLLTTTDGAPAQSQEEPLLDLTGTKPTAQILVRGLVDPEAPPPSSSAPSGGLTRGLPRGIGVTAKSQCENLKTERSRGGIQARRRVAIEILFEVDSAELKPEAIENLEELAKALQDPKLIQSCILIEGHTDSTGSHAHNQSLSLRRADSVRDYLVDRYGIQAGRLPIVGFGEERPIADNGTRLGQRKNRRAQLANLGYFRPAGT